jgi:uncharacterized membrane protein
MNLALSHLPEHWLWPLWGIAVVLAALLFRRIDRTHLKRPDDLNIFLAASVAVLALWLIKTGIKPGLDLHLIGATALTLMFGPWFALLGMALVTLLMTLSPVFSGQPQLILQGLTYWPINWLIAGVIPVLISWRLFRWVDRHLTNHFFVYIFLNAFFGAALATAMVGLSSTLLAGLAGAYAWDYLWANYLPYFMFIAWSEAFSTGMILTVLVIYRPQWIATFDDARYLNR